MRPSPYLAGYSPQGRSPAYPFFRKEKIHPHRRRRNCDAESPERVLLRSCFLRGGAWAARTVSLPCPRRSFGTYERGDRRRTNGTAVVEGFRSWHKVPPRRACERGNITLETFCGIGTTPHAGGSFFLYEKSVLRESDYLRGRKPEVSTDSTPPLFPPLKKPLK